MSSKVKSCFKVPGILICFFLLQVNFQMAYAQCSSTISTFPYSEGFENSNGNWTPGGTASDWTWGSPSKSVITNAYAGQKCWITGGLTGNFYNYNQRAYLISPCFDFTSVANPFISFSVFWDTENQYDGASFQYSLDAGITWNYVGSVGSQTNCLNGNWFNTSSINNLSTLGTNPKNGWSGNTQVTSGSCTGGGGSGQWVIAKQQMTFLGGQASVMFRFTFGAGTQCNNYDGFAIDDIYIANSPPLLTASFTNSAAGCNTANGSASVIVNGGIAPYSYQWNGITGNASTVNNLFAGNYSVVITDNMGCTNTFSTTIPSSPPVQLNGTAITDTCNKNKGGVNLIVTNGTSPFVYLWSSGASSANVQNLSAGVYTVTVTDIKNCTSTSTFTVNNIAGPSVISTTIPDTCGLNTGVININASGGTIPYSYQWQGGTSSNSNITLVAAGNYSITVTDANGCKATTNTTVGNVSAFTFSTIATPDSCSRGKGKIIVNASGGTPPFQYQWSGNVSASSVAQNILSGSYVVTITDNSGCSVTSMPISVGNANSMTVAATATTDTCNKQNGQISILAQNGKLPYSYQWPSGASTNANWQNVAAGTYNLTVNDNGGCSRSTVATVNTVSGFSVSFNTSPDTCNLAKGEINFLVQGGYFPFSYTWQNNISTSPSISNLQAGNYSFTITDATNCSIQETVVIESTGNITINIGDRSIFCPGNPVLLSPGAFDSYLWNTGSTLAEIEVNEPGNYWVDVTDQHGCTASDSVLIVEDCLHDVLFPKAFTPNNDASNDFFFPYYSSIASYSIKIINRWGQVVFESSDPDVKWDGIFNGALCTQGIYAWVAAFTIADESKSKHGYVLLLR